MRSILDKKRIADLRINGRTITLNARVVEALGLEPNDVIDVGMDMRGEYYLYKTLDADAAIGKYEGRLAKVKDNASSLRVHSARLVRAILDRLGTEKSVDLYCGELTVEDGMNVLPVIMRHV